MPLGTEVDLGLRYIVFDVYPATPEKGHTHPTQLLAHVYCGQMAGWMKTPLGTEGSRPRPRPHCTRRGPSSRERGTAGPLFSAHVYCGHGRPSQLLLSTYFNSIATAVRAGSQQTVQTKEHYQPSERTATCDSYDE